MAAAFSAAGIAGDDAGGTTRDSPSTVVPSGATVYAVVASSDGSPVYSNSCVLDPTGTNQAMTQIGADSGTYGGFARARLYQLKNAAGCTAVVRGGWPSPQGERIVNVYVATGADATTPNGTVAQAIGTNTTPSAGAVSTTVGQLVVALGVELNTAGTGRTWDSPTGTERAEAAITGTPFDSAASQDFTATGTSTTLQWTLSNTVDGWVMFAFALNDAAAGGTALDEGVWQPQEPQTNPLTVSVWG